MTNTVSTIIPFCSYDKHLVSAAIESILDQTIKSDIHVIGDGIEIHTLRAMRRGFNNPLITFYRARNLGPYNITNSIVRFHTHSSIIALQDADDISMPIRLECQLETMSKVDHCSAAMSQVALPGYEGNRHLSEPTLLCGVVAGNVPLGRFINSTRMIRTEAFRLLNGFPDVLCSGDLAFDNVIRILKVPSYEFRKILAVRRLHSCSLTNNSVTSRSSVIRKACMDRMKRDLRKLLSKPTLEVAQSFGALNVAQRLEVVE